MSGQIWGISTLIWALLAIFTATIHQIYVWLLWRLEIHYKLISRLLGKYAFPVYEVGFFILFFGRIVLVFLLALANQSTLPIPIFIRVIIIVIMGGPMVYTFYSVLVYFGLHRAAGADHFLAEYRAKSFVKKGIYKYSSNAMYKYALFIIWIPGLLFGSVTALLLAVFNHLYVWVHYYTLEKPDFKLIYGEKKTKT
ncbi:MAG: methyltransferase [Promethearchaeia archaeon]